ncbi:hypothetical protein [Terrimonas pollutisoli]|uniref:hypothetical protein n=1 Tax=Terrimonas pollutisoli TaxID=3034147 RepID=UPI0023EB5EA1|nr:hypothetical protein [Terrimonas sp. H1YJ31]
MENSYNDKEFEHYIKESADQYRMFPSEKVWEGVNNALHTRRKWYGFWLGVLLLLTGGAVTWVMTTHPVSGKNGTAFNNNLPVTNIPAEKVEPKNIEDLLPFAAKETSPLIDSKNEGSFSSFSPVVLSEIEGISVDEVLIDPVLIERPVKSGQHSTFTNINIHPVASFEIARLPEINHLSDAKTIPEALIKTPGQTESYAPYTIESVINSYKYKKPSKKISWQLFVTPTISYRRLSVNKSVDNPSSSNYPFAYLQDVNSAVTHKPDLGLQIGFSGRYPITKGLKVRGGLQFNINRYDIKAYAFNGEVATIDLNGGNGSNSTISTWTYYRNYAGYKSDWLKNFYFSVSTPIGIEMKLAGNEKTSVGVAGTIQPTYVLNDRAYLISTDYKNYAEVPRLIRHVNLSTGFETFVNYTSGKTKWQIGPQVRYQILSSFHNTYPIKENLFDFGLKVGVTLNK